MSGWLKNRETLNFSIIEREKERERRVHTHNSGRTIFLISLYTHSLSDLTQCASQSCPFWDSLTTSNQIWTSNTISPTRDCSYLTPTKKPDIILPRGQNILIWLMNYIYLKNNRQKLLPFDTSQIWRESGPYKKKRALDSKRKTNLRNNKLPL